MFLRQGLFVCVVFYNFSVIFLNNRKWSLARKAVTQLRALLSLIPIPAPAWEFSQPLGLFASKLLSSLVVRYPNRFTRASSMDCTINYCFVTDLGMFSYFLSAFLFLMARLSNAGWCFSSAVVHAGARDGEALRNWPQETLTFVCLQLSYWEWVSGSNLLSGRGRSDILVSAVRTEERRLALEEGDCLYYHRKL